MNNPIIAPPPPPVLVMLWWWWWWTEDDSQSPSSAAVQKNNEHQPRWRRFLIRPLATTESPSLVPLGLCLCPLQLYCRTTRLLIDFDINHTTNHKVFIGRLCPNTCSQWTPHNRDQTAALCTCARVVLCVIPEWRRWWFPGGSCRMRRDEQGAICGIWK